MSKTNNSIFQFRQASTFAFAVQPRIIAISGNHTLNEGGNATLKCLADGNPTPKITWTRLFDDTDIIMPMTDIKRQDAGRYRCTADNGIGKPVTGAVWIVVQCEFCVRLYLQYIS